ncbi:cell division protein FtsQ [Phocaeicola salanitronis]|jgi:cell division protein FtsQ|uniref:cell division protein FtsQ/DivIB n=1 Tax=Phocaeicola salanitronis TaxID=376805 RepID=UPI0023F6773A|nr:cell division protein FtsQ [Phocaeicola salanitronis]
MMKRILILCILLVVSAYLVVSATLFNYKPEDRFCSGIELTIKDSVNYEFITQQGVNEILKRKGLSPKDKRLKDINVRQIEEALAQHPFIAEAECYLTSGGGVAVDIYQRIPLLRIMGNNGDEYYLDNTGKIIASLGKPVHVAVATGFIDRKFAQDQLYQLGKYLQTDAFWNAQIEQINVTPKQELELVPRVGSHILFLGKAEDYNEKFRKLQTFYEKVLSQVGWNKYERISVEFNNQIICTKKEK